MEPRDVWLWLQWYLRFWLPGLQGWQRMFQFIHSQVFWSPTWPDTLELASKNARYVRTTQQSVLFITPFTDPLYQTMKEHKAARLCKRAAFSLLHTLAINQQRWTNTTSQLVFDRGWSRKACSLGYDVDVPRHSEHFVVKVLSGLCNARMNSASSSVHLGSNLGSGFEKWFLNWEMSFHLQAVCIKKEKVHKQMDDWVKSVSKNGHYHLNMLNYL